MKVWIVVLVALFSCQSNVNDTESLSLAQEYYAIGLDYANQKKTEKAIFYFQKAISRNSNFDAAKFNLSLVLARTGGYDSALSRLDEITQVNDKILELRAYLLVQVGRSKEAQKIYAELIERNPGAHRLLFNFAKICDTEESAIKSIDEAISLRPDESLFLMTKAELLTKFKNPTQAVQIYQLIISKDANSREAKFNLALVNFDLKQFQESLNLLRDLREENKQEKKFLLKLIDTQLAMQQTDEQILPSIEDLVKNFSLKEDEIQEVRKGLSVKMQKNLDRLIKDKPQAGDLASDPTTTPK